MGLAKQYKKNIICLESLWDQDLESHRRLSMGPILELVSKINDVKLILLSCNTQEELRYNLLKIKRRSGYGILYFAFHGRPGEVELDGCSIDMETLASFMGRGFVNWAVHFGTCSTVDTDKARMGAFVESTRISMLAGYKKDVVWTDSAALDLLFLTWLQRYKNMRAMWKKFRKTYTGLISNTGFSAIAR
jgi:hypothetical protein